MLSEVVLPVVLQTEGKEIKGVSFTLRHYNKCIARSHKTLN